MHTLGEIAEVCNGLEEISLDQRDVVELRSARHAGLIPIWIQKHLKYTERGGRNQSKWGKLMVFLMKGTLAGHAKNEGVNKYKSELTNSKMDPKTWEI